MKISLRAQYEGAALLASAVLGKDIDKMEEIDAFILRMNLMAVISATLRENALDDYAPTAGDHLDEGAFIYAMQRKDGVRTKK